MRAFDHYPTTWGRVAKVLREHAEHGVQHLHLTGGEPTVHPRFLDVLRLARKLGMRTSVGTIGTRLAHESFAAEALPLLDEALFSLHGPDAATHDALTRRDGSFERQVHAIRRAVRQPGLMVGVNTVVCRDNVQSVQATVDLAESLGAVLVVISNTTPEGAAEDAYDQLAVPLEVLAEVMPAIRAHTAVLRFFGMPMCVLGGNRMLSNDLHWDPRVTVEWSAPEPGKVAFAPTFSWTPQRRRRHVDACAGCAWRGVCMGVYAEYARRWSVDALRAAT
jgi:MoaA/NifB/PqqE/SkfB family radical SAM enzyme